MNKKTKAKETKKSISPDIKKYATLAGKLFLFSLLLLVIPGGVYIAAKTTKQLNIPKEEIVLPPAPPFPKNTTNAVPPQMTAQGVLVTDIPSGIIMYEKNPHVRFAPASTTKIVTALVALDHFKPDSILTVKTEDPNEATMGLVRGEKITMESLLYGLLVKSANDAALTIAENYPGGMKNFVTAMNQKARDLNLKDTRFTNPMGFDDTNHYTTSYDLARFARLALKNPQIAKIVATRSITVSDTDYKYFHELRNVNQLLGGIQGVAGVKTGFTENAEECLVTLVKRNGREILTIVLKSGDRFGETSSLISWAYGNHEWVDISTVPSLEVGEAELQYKQ